ncbi:MAG: hypothetical protein Q9170_001585 [Blastenia crenularia]
MENLQEGFRCGSQVPSTVIEGSDLPPTCPGCGAFTQGAGTPEEAGVYNINRKSVQAFLSHRPQRPNDGLCEERWEYAPGADERSQHPLGLPQDLGMTPPTQAGKFNGKNALDEALPSPLCNRCHCLLHHSGGRSIVHPSLQSIQAIISDSPYSYNHIYHVLDAADFPLSLVPRLQQRLDLMPQRSQNRRAKTSGFSHGRRAEMSFIITRSDLLAPQKEQVDSLMPYLLQVLRDALGSSGRNVRLGNVRCVSAKRGWWTKQVKDEIWERGGGGWMVGKVNVGKSNLFECIFPKGRWDRVTGAHDLAKSLSNPATRHNLERLSTKMPGATGQEFSLLPPPQPEKQYPIMPTVSHLPGTTASPIRIPFGNGKGELIDLPGLARGSLGEHVIESHRSSLVMRQRVKPEQFVIKPGQSLLISGLIRITPTTPGVTVLAYPFVPLLAQVTSTEKAIATSAQAEPSGVFTIRKPEVGQKMGLAGSFQLQWDVTRQRTGPLTSRKAAPLSTQVLPFVVLSIDTLIEGCGWVELVAQLYTIRLGPGAAVLPEDIKRIHLDFAFKLNDGHFGARKVWRNYLPRLKYHNPAVSVTINRSQDQVGPAILTIFYATAHNPATPASLSTAMENTSIPSQTPFERTEMINMKYRHESDILSELMNLTKATQIVATPEEKAELQGLADLEKRMAIDRTRNAEYTAQKKQEKALLDQARGAIGPV